MIIRDYHNRILFLQRANTRHGRSHWCLPGGKVDFGFTVDDAVVKELKEETNLDCRESRFLFFQENVPQKFDDEHYVVLYFFCTASGEIHLNGESSDYRWIALQDLDLYDIAFRNDDAVKKYFENT